MRRGMRNVLSASTAALCLGGLLAACGSADGDGYVASGPAAAGPQRAPGAGVAPTGDVQLVPLDGESSSGAGGEGGEGGNDKPDGSGSPEPGSSDSSGKSADGEAGSDSPATADSGDSTSSGDSSTGDVKPGRTEGSSAGASAGSPDEGGASGSPSAPDGGASTGPSDPSGPAKLSVSAPERKPADDRWCEKVTVTFRNSGESPVRSGTVTFATHIIGALGVDWATIESTEKLPSPIGAGKTVKKTWPVCVEAWRVPLGMHVETQDVSVKWK
ncbi:hypothetical protein AB0I94_17890 [Streptomyces sp. NPDC050147]|uniref:hypothetical protein n=1 Tax=Streptomyces sp. NPDC050147 TaxID=3155513 RepID=UPI003419C5D1